MLNNHTTEHESNVVNPLIKTRPHVEKVSSGGENRGNGCWTSALHTLPVLEIYIRSINTHRVYRTPIMFVNTASQAVYPPSINNGQCVKDRHQNTEIEDGDQRTATQVSTS